MTRTTEAYEDVIEQLVRALTHTTTAVQLMTTAKAGQQPVPAGAAACAPHLVVVRMRKCCQRRGRAVSDVGKSVCQLRRYENDRWLWTSRPYAHSELALRDARKCAELYGWKIVAEAVDSEYGAPESPEDQLTAEVAPEPATATPQSTYTAGFLEGLSRRLGEAASGKLRHGEALGEIAVLVEKELGAAPCSLWPDRYVPDLSNETRGLLNEMMTMLLLTTTGQVGVDIGLQGTAARVEKALGLEDGAIWPENLQAPNGPNACLLEHVRKHEQLLAYLVMQLGSRQTVDTLDMLGTLVEKYTQMAFPEDIKVMTFRHLDTRAAFTRLREATKA